MITPSFSTDKTEVISIHVNDTNDNAKVNESQCNQPITAAEEKLKHISFENALEKKRIYLAVKRFFDIVLSGIALVVLAIPMAIVAFLIKVESPGPVIFSQARMGKNGCPFTIFKFRTMYTDAPSDVATREIENMEQAITPLGHILRRTSIDELPQLINILRGDMSIVGYRPVCLTEKRLNELRMEYGVFMLRPGLTGLAQVSGRDDVDIEEKVQLDVQYVKNCSFGMDLMCILKTVSTVVSGKGVL